jgi:hypothetical protein
MNSDSTLEQSMADRNQNDPKSNAKSAPRPDGDDNLVEHPEDGIKRNSDPDSDRSSASRPRGHTEEPDRTL